MLMFSPLPTTSLTTATSTSTGTTPAPGTCTSDGLRIWDAAGFWRRLKVGETCRTTSTQTITTRVTDPYAAFKVTEGQYATAPTTIAPTLPPRSPLLPPREQIPQEQPPAPGNGATTNEMPPTGDTTTPASTLPGTTETPPTSSETPPGLEPPPPPTAVMPTLAPPGFFARLNPQSRMLVGIGAALLAGLAIRRVVRGRR